VTLRPLLKLLIASIVSVAAAGCANVKLYSETRDKQGQAAVKAWAEVDLKAFFEAQRMQRGKLLEQELDIADKRIAAERELAIRTLSDTAISKIPTFFDEELDALLGPRPAAGNDSREVDVQAYIAAADQIRSYDAQLVRARSLLAERDAPLFSCADFIAEDFGPIAAWKAAHPEAVRLPVLAALKGAKDACEHTPEEEQNRDENRAKLANGAIAATLGRLQTDLSRLKTLESKQGEVQKRFEAALTAYKAELAQSAPGESAKAKLLKSGIFDDIKQLEDAQSLLGQQYISELRVKQINEVVANLKDGTALGADATTAQTLATLLPALTDDVQAIQDAKKGASLVPLLLARDVEQGRLNSANVQLASLRQGIELQQQTFTAQLGQVATLTLAKKEFQAQAAKLQAESSRLAEAWPNLKPQQRKALVTATDLYLDAIGRQKQKVERLARTRYALAIEESASLSEINADIWTSMIGSTVDQAAVYSKTGIKPGDFANVLNTLGILWIGNGTNK
jgi:hypothetical protein